MERKVALVTGAAAGIGLACAEGFARNGYTTNQPLTIAIMERKVALVTGAVAGIGLACAEGFARNGYTTILVDINEPREQAARLLLTMRPRVSASTLSARA